MSRLRSRTLTLLVVIAALTIRGDLNLRQSLAQDGPAPQEQKQEDETSAAETKPEAEVEPANETEPTNEAEPVKETEPTNETEPAQDTDETPDSNAVEESESAATEEKPADTSSDAADEKLPTPSETNAADAQDESKEGEKKEEGKDRAEKKLKAEKPAYIDADNADDDFPFVGEYHGQLSSQDGTSTPIGLQTVALGNGEFTGMLYQGGLPGEGGNRDSREVVTGKRDGKLLKLESENHSIEVKPIHGTMKSKDGKEGQLKKVIRTSGTLGLQPAPCAMVLFDGTDASHFEKGTMSDEGYLNVGTQFKQKSRDFTLHIEYRIPYMPENRSQNRGNSGVYINSRYEVQVLDSFGLTGEKNECGGLYRFKEPDHNMALPPLAWQTYDIRFRSPEFDDDGKKIKNARITVRHNNIVVQDDVEFENKTGAGKKEGPEAFPIKLQDHGSPVHYRNIWMIDHTAECNDPSNAPIEWTYQSTPYEWTPCEWSQPFPCPPRHTFRLFRCW